MTDPSPPRPASRDVRDSTYTDMSHYADSTDSHPYLARAGRLSTLSYAQDLRVPSPSDHGVADQPVDERVENNDDEHYGVARAQDDGQGSDDDSQTQTPPPVPPKAPPFSTPHSASTYYRSSSTNSSVSSFIPARAERARRASASSHNVLSLPSMVVLPQISSPAPSTSPQPPTRDTPPRPTTTPALTSLEGAEPEQPAADDSFELGLPSPGSRTSTGTRTALVAALARLPWAEPPPRLSPTPSIPSMLFPTSATESLSIPAAGRGGVTGEGRSPAYSFLDSDPAVSPIPPLSHSSHSRHSSRASSVSSSHSHSRWQTPLPFNNHGSPLPSSVNVLSPFLTSSNVISDTNWTSSDAAGRRISLYSGMADVSASPRPSFDVSRPASALANPQPAVGRHSEDSLARSLSAAIKRISKQSRSLNYERSMKSRSTGRTKSTKSAKSIDTTRSTKRGSSSTLSHRFGGKRWEVDIDDYYSPLVTSGTVKGKDKQVSAEVEELEEGVEAMKRREEMMDLLTLVGRAAVLERMLRAGKRVSNSTIRLQARQSITTLHRRLTASSRAGDRSGPSRNSTGAAVRGSMSISSTRYSGQATPRTSYSLRKRFTRRIKRDKSEEDLFTELGSDGEEGGETRKDQTLRNSHRHRESSPIYQAELANGGVLVFPEKKLPPVPVEKPKRSPTDNIGCTAIICITPNSPTPLLDEFQDIEKSLGLAQPGPISPSPAPAYTPRPPGESLNEARRASFGSGRTQGWVAQSPHLGHRPPGWRNRQSVVSYLSTGQWSIRRKRKWAWGIGLVAALVLVVIVGLLAGLLSKHMGGETT